MSSFVFMRLKNQSPGRQFVPLNFTGTFGAPSNSKPPSFEILSRPNLPAGTCPMPAETSRAEPLLTSKSETSIGFHSSAANSKNFVVGTSLRVSVAPKMFHDEYRAALNVIFTIAFWSTVKRLRCAEPVPRVALALRTASPFSPVLFSKAEIASSSFFTQKVAE